MDRIKEIEYYDNIKELPAYRYTEFQKMLAYDMCVGSDFSDALRHIEVLITYLSNNKIDMAVKEATNLHNNYYFLLDGLNFKSMCFATLVRKIDGKKVRISDEESIRKVSERIQKILSQERLENIADEVKKKSVESLQLISRGILTMIRQSFSPAQSVAEPS
jgi:hypothetical protein